MLSIISGNSILDGKDNNESKIEVNGRLEIMEANDASKDINIEAEVRSQAQKLLIKVKAGGDLKVLGHEEKLANPRRVILTEQEEFVYKDDVNENIADQIFALEPGQITQELIVYQDGMVVDEAGNFVPGPKNFQIIGVTEKRDFERTINHPKEVTVSHILIAHKDAQRADESITKSDQEAKKLAEEILQKLKDKGDFAELAKEYSNDPGTQKNGGALEDTVSEEKANYVKEFENAALALTKEGQISEVIKSPFGYHIIKADKISEAKTEKTTEPRIKYLSVNFSAAPDPWKETGLNSDNLLRADVEFNQLGQPYVSIKFNDEGAKIFEEITARNIGKQLAIFVGGQLISAPNVNEKISGGKAQITGNFTVDEAISLAKDISAGISHSKLKTPEV